MANASPPRPPIRTPWIAGLPASTAREFFRQYGVVPLDLDDTSDADKTLERPTIVRACGECQADETIEIELDTDSDGDSIDDPTTKIAARLAHVDLASLDEPAAFALRPRASATRSASITPSNDARTAAPPAGDRDDGDERPTKRVPTLRPVAIDADDERVPPSASWGDRIPTPLLFAGLAMVATVCAVASRRVAPQREVAPVVKAQHAATKVLVAIDAPSVAPHVTSTSRPIVADAPRTDDALAPAAVLSALPKGFGLVTFAPSIEKGHRVWVDGFVSTYTPVAATVRCGVHQIRVGSASASQSVDVPCGRAVRLPLR